MIHKLLHFYLFKNGFQLPCIVGLSVCHHFFNLVTLMPEEVLSKETWRLISLGVRFFTDTIRLFPFTRWKKITLLNTSSLHVHMELFGPVFLPARPKGTNIVS